MKETPREIRTFFFRIIFCEVIRRQISDEAVPLLGVSTHRTCNVIIWEIPTKPANVVVYQVVIINLSLPPSSFNHCSSSSSSSSGTLTFPLHPRIFLLNVRGRGSWAKLSPFPPLSTAKGHQLSSKTKQYKIPRRYKVKLPPKRRTLLGMERITPFHHSRRQFSHTQKTSWNKKYPLVDLGTREKPFSFLKGWPHLSYPFFHVLNLVSIYFSFIFWHRIKISFWKKPKANRGNAL